MKIAIHILSIYLLALSLVPCGDGGGGIVEMANHLLGIEHMGHADHEQHSNACNDDDCTPFCICTCCSTVLDYPEKLAVLVIAPLPMPSTSPSFVPNIILSSFTTSIWQPPQFA